MSEQQSDPSGDTEQFRAFARRGEPEPTTPNGPNLGLIIGIGIGVVAIIVVAVVAFMALGS
ncbi:MAG TPA: hypothetical protein VGP70_06990 [Actinomadura sp.]|jgi:hypothetical protein|nr:hypothetical protein [Actinomadura sp.]